MRYLVDYSLTPRPNIITDRERFTPANIFAVTCCALGTCSNAAVIARLSLDDMLYYSAKAWTFSDCNETRHNYQYDPSFHSDGTPYGIAGTSWQIFGKDVIHRLGYYRNTYIIWQYFDAIVTKIDASSLEEQSNHDFDCFYGQTNEEFETACEAMEQFIYAKIQAIVADLS